MWKGSTARRRKRVMTVQDAGDQARSGGDLPTAVARYREAADAIRELAGSSPDEDDLLQLGSTLYTLGELLIEDDADESAIAVLHEAESAYDSVGAHQVMIADVRQRRARAHAQLDHRASALTDTQSAVLAYTNAFSGQRDDPVTLDTARILAHHSLVVLTHGDPDMAVSAADQCIRLYLSIADEINQNPGLLALHGPAFMLATDVAHAIHDAYGRSELAREAGDLGAEIREASSVVDTRTGKRIDVDTGDLLRLNLPGPDVIRAKLTLAEALDQVGADELRHELTEPAVDGNILTVADRTSMGRVAATRLAGEADRVIDTDPRTAMRIALEANALFALFTEYGDARARYQFDVPGATWAHMLMRCSRAAETAGFRSAALDFARWRAAVVTQLVP